MTSCSARGCCARSRPPRASRSSGSLAVRATASWCSPRWRTGARAGRPTPLGGATVANGKHWVPSGTGCGAASRRVRVLQSSSGVGIGSFPLFQSRSSGRFLLVATFFHKPCARLPTSLPRKLSSPANRPLLYPLSCPHKNLSLILVPTDLSSIFPELKKFVARIFVWFLIANMGKPHILGFLYRW